MSSVNNNDVPEGENKAEDKENCSTLEEDDLQILDNPVSVTNTCSSAFLPAKNPKVSELNPD